MLQVVETICFKLADKKSWQLTCIKHQPFAFLVMYNREGRITQKIVYEIFVISKSQDIFERFFGFLRDFWGSFDQGIFRDF